MTNHKEFENDYDVINFYTSEICHIFGVENVEIFVNVLIIFIIL